MHALERRIPPVPVAAVSGLAMGLSTFLWPGWRWPNPWLTGTGAALGFLGGVLALGGIAAFRAARTTTNPLRSGAPSALVTSGVYRLSRNPMYAGLLLCLAGWALHLAHPLPFLVPPLFVAYMNRFQIAPEERSLAERFGADFAAYRNRVRRWL